MVRVINTTGEKRDEAYYKAKCPWCGSMLIFEQGEIWIDDNLNNTGRIECPVCRTKVFMTLPLRLTQQVDCMGATKEEYDNALKDTSRSGLETLKREKELSDGSMG